MAAPSASPVGEYSYQIQEVHEAVERMAEAIHDTKLGVGMTAALVLHLMLGSPRPLSPQELQFLVRECSLYSSNLLHGICEGKLAVTGTPHVGQA